MPEARVNISNKHLGMEAEEPLMCEKSKTATSKWLFKLKKDIDMTKN